MKGDDRHWDRRELAQQLSDRTDLSIKQVETILKVLPTTLRAAIRGGKKVYLRGFGTFYGKALPAGNVKMPGGRHISVPARTKLAFKPVRKKPKSSSSGKAKKVQR